MGHEDMKLGEWEQELRGQLEILQGQREKLDAEFQKLSKKLDLLRQMRVLEGELDHAYQSAFVTQDRSTPSLVRELSHRILSESPTPLHISEIHRQFKERGFAIPGSGTPFNILAHLVNNKSFVRVARGTYALAGTVPKELVLAKAPRRVRRRRREKPQGLPR